MNILKKILSLFLAVLFAISTAFAVFAEDESISIVEQETETEENSQQDDEEIEVDPVYIYVFIDGTTTEPMKDAPDNTQQKVESNGEGMHTVTTYTWGEPEPERKEVDEDAGEGITDNSQDGESSCDDTTITTDTENTGSNENTEITEGTEDTQNYIYECIESTVEDCVNFSTNVAKKVATCTQKGNETGKKCSVCGYVISGCEEISALGHSCEYKVTVAPSCTSYGTVASTPCKNCGKSFTYPISPSHQYVTVEGKTVCAFCGKEAVESNGCEHENKEVCIVNVRSATCTEAAQHVEIEYCAECREEINRKTVETGEPLGHKWATDDIKCLRCGVEDKPISIANVECDKTAYFQFDKWASNLTLTVVCENHKAVIKTKTNLLSGFSTQNTGTFVLKVKYKNIEYSGIKITVTKPKITITQNGDTLVNGNNRYVDDRGIVFYATTNTGDVVKCKLGCSDLTASVSKVNDTKYKITVKPKSTFKGNSSGQKYNVKIYFGRNNQEYATTIYINFGILSLKCATGSSTMTYKKDGTVNKTVAFKQTYLDSKTSTVNQTLALNLSSVGVKTKNFSYYGKSATYTYYVKCATPALKATSASKAVSLSWKKITGATGYKIYRSTSKDGTYKAVKTISSGSTTSYKNTGLTAGKTYYYKIVAIYSKNSKCNSSASAVVSCKAK